MATHCGILAWKIPWTEETGGLQSMGSESDMFKDIQFLKNIYFYLFLALLGLCCFEGFSLVVASRGYSLVADLGFPLLWHLWLGNMGSRVPAWAKPLVVVGSWAVEHRLNSCGALA